MDRVNRYLLQHFIAVFASLFTTLFFIMSIVFFIQIARITSVIQITFWELGKLYIFMLPKIFLFTVPISFFIAIALMLFKLSRENETIVLFTLGHAPAKIAKFFMLVSVILTSLLLVNSMILIPLSMQLNANFVDYKRTEAKLNIKATEFGQKFSDWLVFMEGSSEGSSKQAYERVVMYKDGGAKENERIVLSQNADIINNQGELKLKLQDGRAYEMSPESLHQVTFKTMIIHTQPNNKVKEVTSIKEYWMQITTNAKRAKNFAFYILISLFPIVSVLFALSFGIVTYRYQRSGIYGSIFLVIFTYFAAIMLFAKNYPFIAIGSISLLFLISSIVVFKKKILARY